jgi:DNA-binding NarL/FixJ family response regulator
MNKINVAVIAECNIIQTGFQSILAEEKNNIILYNSHLRFKDFTNSYLKDIDIVIVNMQDLSFIGIEKLHEAISTNPDCRIIMCCVDESDKKVPSLIAYGIKGIIYNNDSPHTIVKAIKKVYEGELWIKREILTQFIESSFSYSVDTIGNNDSTLTRREREILFMLAKGFSNNDIAEEIGVSVATVKTHIYRIFKKTNIKNRAEAAGYLKGL